MLLEIVDWAKRHDVDCVGVCGGRGTLSASLHEFHVALCFFRSSSDLAYCLITSNSSLTEVG